MIIPVWMIFASSTHTSSIINMQGLQLFLGDSFYENYLRVLLYQGGFFKEITALKMFFNSFIMAPGVALLSVVTSLMAAYALVYYRIKYATLLFWIIFITILVPLELRIFPTYSVMAELNLVNSYFGLIVPISASALATSFFIWETLDVSTSCPFTFLNLKLNKSFFKEFNLLFNSSLLNLFISLIFIS